MFLLFYENVASERELMRIIPDLGLPVVPGLRTRRRYPGSQRVVQSASALGNGGIRSKRLFVRTVGQCVTAGLVDGTKIHVDSSLNEANASCDLVVTGGTELIAALKAAYHATASKLDDATTPWLTKQSTTVSCPPPIRMPPWCAKARSRHAPVTIITAPSMMPTG